MFLALGVGAFAAGIFHLMTHAFFKALLFLGAGSVIHASPENRICARWAVCGARSRLPPGHFDCDAGNLWNFPFAGFFSKDEILGAPSIAIFPCG